MNYIRKAKKKVLVLPDRKKSNKINDRIALFFGHRFGHDFWDQNAPKMTPKSTKMSPLGPKEAPWRSHGPPKMPQDRFQPQFGTPNDPKITQNGPKMSPKWAQLHKRDPKKDPQHAPRPTLAQDALT